MPPGVISLVLSCNNANDVQVRLDLTARSGAIQTAKIGLDFPTNLNDRTQITRFRDTLAGLKLYEVRDFTMLSSQATVGAPRDLYGLSQFLNGVFGLDAK